MTRDEFITYANAMWTFKPEGKMKDHPAAFPLELPKRLIKMNTYIGDTVLDPFMGSGTTGVACRGLHRNFIGIELDKEYYQVAKERIKNEEPLPF